MSNFSFFQTCKVCWGVNFCKFVFFYCNKFLIVNLKLTFIFDSPIRYLQPIIPHPEKKCFLKRKWLTADPVVKTSHGKRNDRRRSGAWWLEYVSRKDKERKLISYLKWKGRLVGESTARWDLSGRPQTRQPLCLGWFPSIFGSWYSTCMLIILVTSLVVSCVNSNMDYENASLPYLIW